MIGLITAADDSEAVAALIQILNQSAREKPGVSQKTDAALGNGTGDFLEAASDKVPSSGVGTRIPRSQRAMPEFLSMSFEAEDGMVRGSAFGFGIIT